jgi:hypothetical protein
MTARPAKPTIAQIREVSQPLSVTGRSNAEHWVADLYLRKISPYLTRLLLHKWCATYSRNYRPSLGALLIPITNALGLLRW